MSVITMPVSANAVLIRTVISAVSATVVTFALFVLMQFLIAFDGPQFVLPDEPATIIELMSPPPETSPATRQLLPPKPQQIPQELLRSDIQPTDSGAKINMTGFQPDKLVIDTSTGISHSGQLADKTATPLFRAEPRFPPEALRQGISGWVILSFSIDETGSVTDIAVVAAEPRNLFEREAVRALRRWKYQPQIIDGKTVRQTNLQVQLDFALQNE